LSPDNFGDEGMQFRVSEGSVGGSKEEEDIVGNGRVR